MTTDSSSAFIRILLAGLTLSGSIPLVDSYGVKAFYGSIEGLRDLPEVTGSFVQSPYGDGGHETDSHYGPRTLVLKGWVIAPGTTKAQQRTNAEAALARFKAEIGKAKRTAIPLILVEDGRTRHIMVRIVQQQHFGWDLKNGGKFTFDLQFRAADPRIIWGDGITLVDQVETFLSSTGTPASISLENEGANAVPDCEIALYGFDHPTLTHLETGRSFTVNESFADDDFAVVNFKNRTIKDSAGNSLRGNKTIGRLFKLLEDTNSFQITAATYSPSAVMRTAFRSASN